MKKIISFMLLHFCVVSTALGSSAGFCLKKCTEEFCAQSQENYQQCQDSCRGKYEGLIAKCKLVAKKEGYHDLSVNEDAKFSPCLTGQNAHPALSSDADDRADEEKVMDPSLGQKDEADSDRDEESKPQDEDDDGSDHDDSATDEASASKEDDSPEDTDSDSSDDSDDDSSEET
jgi:hypothetical protein